MCIQQNLSIFANGFVSARVYGKRKQQNVAAIALQYMANKYLTIEASGDGLYKDKGSRFLSFAERVDCEEDAKSLLERYRKRYHDARHVCYAWVLGDEGETCRSSDDGEPSGTAGKPILTQIQSRKLTLMTMRTAVTGTTSR